MDIRDTLAKERIVLEDGVDPELAWQALNNQYARFDEDQATDKRCASSNAEGRPECECRIAWMCDGCGGPTVCSLADRKRYAKEFQRRACYDRGQTWIVYKISENVAMGNCDD